MRFLYAPQPLRIDHLRQALEERLGLQLDLPRELEVRDEVDVLQPVLLRHGDVAPVGDQVDALGLAEFFQVKVQISDCPVGEQSV